ncbi:MAG: hypothetical protein RSB99_03705, partial [Bacilli bacterium]
YSLKDKVKSVLIDDYEKFDTLIVTSEHHNQELEVEEQITLDDIWKIISSEPQDVQKIMSLYYLSDTIIEDIATMLKQNPNTIKTKLYRTVAKIRKSCGRC